MNELLPTTLVIHQNLGKLMFIGVFMLEVLSIFHTIPASISELPRCDRFKQRNFCILLSPYHSVVDMLGSALIRL